MYHSVLLVIFYLLQEPTDIPNRKKINEVGVCQRLVCQKRKFTVRSSSYFTRFSKVWHAAELEVMLEGIYSTCYYRSFELLSESQHTSSGLSVLIHIKQSRLHSTINVFLYISC